MRLILGHWNGINTGRMTPGELVKRAQTTSDFPLLLADSVGKSINVGYNEPTGTHRAWSSKAARDFKDKKFVAASETPALDLVNEDGEFTHGVLTDDGMSVRLSSYGKLMSFSRQAIINDDTGELLRTARNWQVSAMCLNWILLTAHCCPTR